MASAHFNLVVIELALHYRKHLEQSLIRSHRIANVDARFHRKPVGAALQRHSRPISPRQLRYAMVLLHVSGSDATVLQITEEIQKYATRIQAKRSVALTKEV